MAKLGMVRTMKEEIFLGIVTLADCIYQYEKLGRYAVCSRGKLLGFVEEEAGGETNAC